MSQAGAPGVCGMCAGQIMALKGDVSWASSWAREYLHGPLMILERTRCLNIMCRKVAMSATQFTSFLDALNPNIEPRALAQELGRAPGGPVLTAKQAAAVLRKLGHPRLDDYVHYHVVCSRVIDRWALNGDEHDIAACYCARSPRGMPPQAIFDAVQLLDWLIAQGGLSEADGGFQGGAVRTPQAPGLIEQLSARRAQAQRDHDQQPRAHAITL